MRAKLLFFTILFLVTTINAAIWRVSQDATYLPHFSQIQAAVDGASAGDTIYVYPGSYAGVTVSKLLTIIGPGYCLTENKKDSLTKFTTTTYIPSVTLKRGSDYSVLIGLNFTESWNSYISCDSTTNINIIGCRVNRIYLSNSRLVNIQRNYIPGFYEWPNGGGYMNLVNSKNIIISNNIIYCSINADNNSELYLRNNYISENLNLTNSTLENNILMGSSFSLSTCWEQNNIFKTGCNYSALSSYSFYATSAEVYPLNPVADNFQLSNTSVAKGKGVGGSDCGPFGGVNPYRLSGISSIPSIVSLFTEPQVSNESGLKMRVKVKGNKP